MIDDNFLNSKRKALEEARRIAENKNSDELIEFISFLLVGRSYRQAMKIINGVISEIQEYSIIESLPEAHERAKRTHERGVLNSQVINQVPF